MTRRWHLVEYRRRVLTPARLAGRVDSLRFWRPLDLGGDFGWFRDHPSRWALYRRLKPDFRRWAFYAVWDDDAALDRFLANPPRRWADGWAECLSLRLRPRAARGPWAGVDALEAPAAEPAREGTVAHIVRLDLSLRGTLAMWGSAAPHILRFLPDAHDLLLGIPLVDRPYMQPVSFSLWRSPDAVRQFARHRGRAPTLRPARSAITARSARTLFHRIIRALRVRRDMARRNPVADAIGTART